MDPRDLLIGVPNIGTIPKMQEDFGFGSADSINEVKQKQKEKTGEGLTAVSHNKKLSMSEGGGCSLKKRGEKRTEDRNGLRSLPSKLRVGERGQNRAIGFKKEGGRVKIRKKKDHGEGREKKKGFVMRHRSGLVQASR